MAKKSPWGVCTTCGWEHNEAREYKMCYECREKWRGYSRKAHAKKKAKAAGKR